MKISQLSSLTNAQLAVDDVLPIVDTDNSQTKKIAVSELDTRYKDPVTSLAALVAALQLQVGVTPFGTIGVPRAISALGGISSSNADMSTTALSQVVFVSGPTPGSNVLVTASPAIEAHTVVGATMRIQLASTSGLQFKNGTGVELYGEIYMYDVTAGKNFFDVWWTGTAWREYGRGF